MFVLPAAVTMSSVQALTEFVSVRLTAAAVEIFREFEQTIVQYEEKIDGQRRLLDITWKKDQIKAHTADFHQHHIFKVELLQNQDNESSLIQEEPAPPEIKEEPEPPQIKEEPEPPQITEDSVSLQTIHHQEGPQTPWIQQNQEVQTSVQLVLEPLADGESDPAEQMCLNSVREFINGRLTAAAVEMSSMFEQTLGRYQKEFDGQHRLLKIIMNPQVKLHRLDVQQPHVSVREQQLCNQSGNSFVVQEQHQMEEEQEGVKPPKIEENQWNPEPQQVKENQACSSQEGDQLLLKPTAPSSMDSSTDEGGDPSQTESDSDHLFHNTAAAEIEYQVQDTCGDSGSSRNEDLKLIKRRRNNQKLHNRAEKNYSCEQCGITFTERKSFFSLKKTHQSEKLHSCQTCGKGFEVKTELLQHEVTHTIRKCNSCQICGKSFSRKDYVLKHMRTHTGEKPFKCGNCGRCFPRKDNLLNHMKTHTGEKPLKCGNCGKHFPRNDSLLSHIRTHTGEKPFNCENCSRCFRRKDGLLNHMKTHTGNNTFPCQSCGKSFSTKHALFLHMRIHTSEKPFSCETCGKCFPRSYQLLCHLHSHKGEWPFACETCGKGFFHKRDFRRHGQTHTGEKPHSCQLCKKAFGQRSTLMMHMKTHTSEKPYNCVTCGKDFRWKQTFKNHMKTHRSDQLNTC